MHKAGVLHRDVKPENILLDANMRIRIADFGSARTFDIRSKEPQEVLTGNTQRPSSFVGTAEYVSPELLTDKRVSEASDYWAMGCILFQMLCGRPPFKGASEYQTFQKIMRRELDFQEHFPEVAKDLINKLLSLDPTTRPKPSEAKEHAFFKGVDWNTIWTRPAPELKAGLYQRQAEQRHLQASEEEGLSGENEEHEEEDGDADDTVSLEGPLANEQRIMPHIQQKSWETHVDDADDDESSMSDSNAPVFRKRGFSAGASAAERMLSQVSSTTRKGSSNILNKMAAGFAGDKNTGRPSPLGPMSTNPEYHSPRSSQQPSYQASDTRLYASLATSWAALLLPQESLLYACPVLHKTTSALLRNNTKKRQLLLTDFPRLLCVKETNDQLKVKSEIILGVPRGNVQHEIPDRSITPTSTSTDDKSIHQEVQREASRQPAEGDRSSQINRASAPWLTHMRRQSSAGPLLPSSPPLDREQQVPQRGNGEIHDAIAAGKRNSGAVRTQPTASTPSTQLSPNVMTSIEAKSIRSFVVHTPARSYLYEDPTGDASHWIKSITIAAQRHGLPFASS